MLKLTSHIDSGPQVPQMEKKLCFFKKALRLWIQNLLNGNAVCLRLIFMCIDCFNASLLFMQFVSAKRKCLISWHHLSNQIRNQPKKKECLVALCCSCFTRNWVQREDLHGLISLEQHFNLARIWMAFKMAWNMQKCQKHKSEKGWGSLQHVFWIWSCDTKKCFCVCWLRLEMPAHNSDWFFMNPIHWMNKVFAGRRKCLFVFVWRSSKKMGEGRESKRKRKGRKTKQRLLNPVLKEIWAHMLRLRWNPEPGIVLQTCHTVNDYMQFDWYWLRMTISRKVIVEVQVSLTLVTPLAHDPWPLWQLQWTETLTYWVSLWNMVPRGVSSIDGYLVSIWVWSMSA